MLHHLEREHNKHLFYTIQDLQMTVLKKKTRRNNWHGWVSSQSKYGVSYYFYTFLQCFDVVFYVCMCLARLYVFLTINIVC
jgi:hypothetical protein